MYCIEEGVNQKMTFCTFLHSALNVSCYLIRNGHWMMEWRVGGRLVGRWEGGFDTEHMLALTTLPITSCLHVMKCRCVDESGQAGTSWYV